MNDTPLDDLASEFGLSASGLRRRITALGLAPERGSRGRWVIDDALAATLRDVDRLMSEGAGTATVRRVLALPDPTPAASTDHAPTTDATDPPPSGPLEAAALEVLRELLREERDRAEALQAEVTKLTGVAAAYQARAAVLGERLAELEAPRTEPAAVRPWWRRWV